MQICKSPNGFMAMMILFTQLVGSSTGFITPKLVSLSNSSFRADLKAKGTCLPADIRDLKIQRRDILGWVLVTEESWGEFTIPVRQT